MMEIGLLRFGSCNCANAFHGSTSLSPVARPKARHILSIFEYVLLPFANSFFDFSFCSLEATINSAVARNTDSVDGGFFGQQLWNESVAFPQIRVDCSRIYLGIRIECNSTNSWNPKTSGQVIVEVFQSSRVACDTSDKPQSVSPCSISFVCRLNCDRDCIIAPQVWCCSDSSSLNSLLRSITRLAPVSGLLCHCAFLLDDLLEFTLFSWGPNNFQATICILCC